VFTKNNTNPAKGDMIFAQGAYFEMNNTTDVESIIKNFLNGKGTGNIKVEVDTDGNLTISETSLASLKDKKDSTELVQAKAVAGALATPVSLTLAVKDDVGTFSETFTTLNGDTTEAVTAVFEGGSNIKLTQGEKGLVITAKDTTYNAGTGISIAQATGEDNKAIADTFVINHSNTVTEKKTAGGETVTLSAADKDFKLDQLTYDAQGHITGSVERTVTLPDSAFETYAVSAAADGSNVKVNLDKTLGATTTTDSISLAGSGDVTVSVAGNAGAEVITITDIPYVGKEAIAVSATTNTAGNKEVSLIIDPSDVVLTQSDAGLKTNLELWYKSSSEKYNGQFDKDANGVTFKENHVYLLGKDKDTIPYIVSEFNATSFVKDSFLSDVQYLVITGEEQEGDPGYGAGVEPGKYIAFYFTTMERDTEKNVNDLISEEHVIYLNVKDFYTPISVSGDDASYSVVNKSTGADGSDVYTIKNTLGTISRDNAKNTITVDKAGLATVGDIKTVLETIDSDLDAAYVKPTGGRDKDANEVEVVTGITQTNGKVVSVDTKLAATKEYVDNAITAATPATGTISLTNGEKGSYVFAEEAAGYVTAEHMAAIMNEAWSWGSIINNI
jgi:hypothetical protein